MPGKFRLLLGNHNERGTTFTAGDVIESDTNLEVRFPGKFVKELEIVERVKSAPSPAVVEATTVRPVSEDEEPVEEETGEEPADDRGEDVTSDFLAAEGKGAQVFFKDDVYTVVKDEEEVFSAKGATAVKKFLKTLE